MLRKFLSKIFITWLVNVADSLSCDKLNHLYQQSSRHWFPISELSQKLHVKLLIRCHWFRYWMKMKLQLHHIQQIWMFLMMNNSISCDAFKCPCCDFYWFICPVWKSIYLQSKCIHELCWLLLIISWIITIADNNKILGNEFVFRLPYLHVIGLIINLISLAESNLS